MPTFLKAAFRKRMLSLCRALGSELVDCRSNQPLGRALVVPWRGRILLLGYEGSAPLRLVFQTQPRLTYWKQVIGFTTHPPPDFPHESRP